MAENIETRISSEQAKEAIYQAHLSKDAIAKIAGLNSSASEIDNMVTRNWIDYVTIKNLEDLGNGIIKYTDTNGSYYRKIIDSPYEDIIYSDATLTIELTRR
jgi:glucose-6-phosphate 1-dehydrogenase